jgi:hypothetical protein
MSFSRLDARVAELFARIPEIAPNLRRGFNSACLQPACRESVAPQTDRRGKKKWDTWMDAY